jgi:hypothetical protein
MWFKIYIDILSGPETGMKDSFFINVSDSSNIINECRSVLWERATDELTFQYYKIHGLLAVNNIPSFLEFLIGIGMSKEDIPDSNQEDNEAYLRDIVKKYFGDISQRYKIIGIFLASDCEGCRNGAMGVRSHDEKTCRGLTGFN